MKSDDHPIEIHDESDNTRAGTPDESHKKKFELKKMGSQMTQGAFQSAKAVGSVWNDFKEFLNRGNVVDLAVGIVMGAAFTAIVNSLVNDIVMPVVGMAVSTNFDQAYIALKCPPGTELGSDGVNLNGTISYCAQGKQGPWNTIVLAKAAGAITWNWGSFIQNVINFILISIVVFFLVKMYAASFRRPAPKATRTCPYCAKDIPLKATRCFLCCSEVEPQVAEAPKAAPLFSMANNVANHVAKNAAAISRAVVKPKDAKDAKDKALDAKSI